MKEKEFLHILACDMVNSNYYQNIRIVYVRPIKLYHVYWVLSVLIISVSCSEDIPPTPPDAKFEYSIQSSTGKNHTYLFDASSSTDMNDPVNSLLVRWDFTSDGIFDTDWSINKRTYHSYSLEEVNASGEVEVTLSVIDPDNMVSESKKLIRLNISEPEGYISVVPEEGNQLTEFDISCLNALDDFNSDSLRIRWDFGNDGEWTEWKWKKEGGQPYGFSFQKKGLSYDGDYQIAAEIQDLFENTKKMITTIHLHQLPRYEILNVDNYQIFSGNDNPVQLRVLYPRAGSVHILYVNNLEQGVSAMVKHLDMESNEVDINLFTDYYDDGEYRLFSVCAYLSSSGWQMLERSEEIPVIFDNGGASKIEVLSPTSNSIWVPGQEYKITWTPYNINNHVIVNLLSADGGGILRTIGKNIINDGSISYTLDNDIPTGKYKITVDVAENNEVGFGVSENFLISNPAPLEIIDYFGPFANLSDLDFIQGSDFFYALSESDPLVYKISLNKIISQFEFWENSTGTMPKYGGFVFDGENEDSDLIVARSSTGYGSEYPCVVRYKGGDLQSVVTSRRFESISGIVYKFTDMCQAAGYLYLLDDFRGKVSKLDKGSLQILEEFDIENVRTNYGDKMMGIAYDKKNFWIVFTNAYLGGSSNPQVIKLNSNFEIMARFKMPNSVNPTGIEWNMNDGLLYLTTTDGIYKLAKE